MVHAPQQARRTESPAIAPPANDSAAQSASSVATLGQIGRAAWDAFVYREETATFFHLSGWQNVIERTLGHQCHFLAAVSDSRVVGVLPLVHVRSRLFGSSLVATGFCVYGGIAASTPAAVQTLSEAAVALARKLGVAYVELRSREAVVPGWPVKSDVYATFRRPLWPTEAENLKAIPRKKRADVRKAIKAAPPIDTGGDLDGFYRVYSESLRSLGTPVQSKRYFAAIRAEFGDACEISVVQGPDGPVAGLMSFYFRDAVLPYFGGGTAAARPLHAYDGMYWSLMCRAAERGAKVFDFGRSKFGTGAFDYKTFWGFEPEALEYQYYLHKASEVPNINPENPKYKPFTRLWKKLPLPVANTVGPYIAAQLG